MIDDVFRDRLRRLSAIEVATANHLDAISDLASRRRKIIVEMVDLAKASGHRAPQQYVAERLGISQQTVSKIINRK